MTVTTVVRQLVSKDACHHGATLAWVIEQRVRDRQALA
jgi:hypothetical protein